MHTRLIYQYNINRKENNKEVVEKETYRND